MLTVIACRYLYVDSKKYRFASVKRHVTCSCNYIFLIIKYFVVAIIVPDSERSKKWAIENNFQHNLKELCKNEVNV